MIRVVNAIQTLKSRQQKWSQVLPAERKEILLRLRDQLLHQGEFVKNWEAQESLAGNSEDFTRHCFSPGLAALDQAIKELSNPESGTFPTGLVSVVLPSIFIFRTLMERLAPALAAGNLVLVKLSSKGKDCSLQILQLLNEAGLPEGVVQILHGKSSDMGELVTRHPAIQALTFAGSFAASEKILQQATALGRKIQISGACNSSALVLGQELPSEKSLALLARACFSHQGRLPWSIKKIFVSEDLLGAFVPAFSLVAKKLYGGSTASVPQFAAQLAELTKLGSKFASENPWILPDLSHCSTLQQDEISGPLALISGVKYSFDGIKWINTGYLGGSVLLLGPEDKALKLVEKLETGHIWINDWLSPADGPIQSVKQAQAGNLDFRVFGNFFSNRRKTVIGPSKD